MNTCLRCVGVLLAVALLPSCFVSRSASEAADGSTEVGYPSDVGVSRDASAPEPDVGVPAPDAAAPGEDAGPVAPVLEVDPAKLDFGSVAGAGQSKQLSLTLKNAGPAASRLQLSVELAPGSSPAMSVAWPPAGWRPAGLAGGESVAVEVSFAPQVFGKATAKVLVHSNHPAQALLEVPVAGAARESELLVAPYELDFGVVGEGCQSRERVFTLYNVSKEEQTLQAIELQSGSSQDFRVVRKPTLPTRIQAGGSADFKMQYAPAGVGADQAAVVLSLSGGFVPAIPVRGEGVPRTVAVDVFEQGELTRVDILFVIDDSPSMADERAALLANLGAFYEFLEESAYLDFQLAVATTGVDAAHGGLSTPAGGAANGCILPLTGSAPKVITRQTPNAKQAFLQNVDVGTSGSDDEFLIRPAVLAVTEPNLSGCNAGFVRADASLAIVVVSDSPDMDTASVDAYVASLLGVKGLKRQDLFTFSAVVSKGAQAAQCTPETGAVASTRALEVVQKTSGISEELCKQDWHRALEHFGLAGFLYTTKFFLAQIPDLAFPITVEVDGVVLAPVGPGGDTRWNFDLPTNSIQFQQGWVPAPRTTVTVRHTAACP